MVYFSPEFVQLQDRQQISDPRYDELHRYSGGQPISVHAKSDDDQLCIYEWSVELWRAGNNLHCRISYDVTVPQTTRVNSVYCRMRLNEQHAHGIQIALHDQDGKRLGELVTDYSHFGTWMDYIGVRRGQRLSFSQELSRPISIRPTQVHSLYVIPSGDTIGVDRHGLP